MNCPYCEHGETKVIDTRVAGKGAIRRRRECLLCGQRMTTFERVEQAAVRIEADLRNGVGDEVEARKIGEQALRVLRELDRVAYVRFASVYRDFQDVDEFERELAQLEGRKKPARRVAKRTSVR